MSGSGEAGTESPGPPEGWLRDCSLCGPSRLRPEPSDDKCAPVFSVCLACTRGHPPLRIQQQTVLSILEAAVTEWPAALPLARKRPPSPCLLFLTPSREPHVTTFSKSSYLPAAHVQISLHAGGHDPVHTELFLTTKSGDVCQQQETICFFSRK